MKKGSTIIKIIASSLMIVMGIFIAIGGSDGAPEFFYDGISTGYKSYGGDAYTGIQNGIADISENVRSLGNAIEYFLYEVYLYCGIIMVIVGLYMLGGALGTINKKTKAKVKAAVSSPIADNVTSEIDAIKSIENYKGLLDAGTITQEEFDSKKKQLLGF